LKQFKLISAFIAVLLIPVYLCSCATITVNVYFPAEEVNEAYTSLEQEFLKQEPDDESDSEIKQEQETEPKIQTNGEVQSKTIYKKEPTLQTKKIVILKKEIKLDFSHYAWAQENLDRQITNELRSMPNVIKSFKSRGKRVKQINQMLKEHKVGEGSNGKLEKLTNLSTQENNLMNAENKDREVIIRGMASAILKINNLQETTSNLNRVMGEASKEFADVRYKEAPKGSMLFINGNWVEKK